MEREAETTFHCCLWIPSGASQGYHLFEQRVFLWLREESCNAEGYTSPPQLDGRVKAPTSQGEPIGTESHTHNKACVLCQGTQQAQCFGSQGEREKCYLRCFPVQACLPLSLIGLLGKLGMVFGKLVMGNSLPMIELRIRVRGSEAKRLFVGCKGFLVSVEAKK